MFWVFKTYEIYALLNIIENILFQYDNVSIYFEIQAHYWIKNLEMNE